ncbi:MAG TPA: phosphoribosylaminoimidazolesuccinocarboxamide synthase [Blastocatellia bacterium]|nr:phosphoribosylaminoimidazolesuccinocarboxamide synthase [Blastocatellia bacterium]
MPASPSAIPVAELPELSLLRRGKVRDVYEVNDDRLLIIATDRISAFDCILPNAIPHKGQVLTQISRFWFGRSAGLVPNHLLATRVTEFPAELRGRLSPASLALLAGRSMLTLRAEVVPFECVVRGYLAGSGWKDYQATGSVCGHRLPAGLVESAKLPEPIFTPATKAEAGHDINVSIDEMAQVIGREKTRRLEQLSLDLYREAARYAESRGIIICDTKFEFGVRDGELILIDEALTPDSSRFWPQDRYSPGGPQPSFDKQYVRDYLETLAWDKRPPAPELPPEVVSATSAKYLEAYRLITGHELTDELKDEII